MALTAKDLTKIRKLMKSELKRELNDGLKPINKKLDIAIKFFDNDYLRLEGRVDRIERILKITPLS